MALEQRMAKRMFTLAEATAELPWLEEALRRIQRLIEEVRRNQERMEAEALQARSNGRTSHEEPMRAAKGRADAARGQIEAVVQEIADRGIVLRDPSRGLVDFPSLRNGREVYLCWLRGEPAIAFWHEVDTGIAGRQPL